MSDYVTDDELLKQLNGESAKTEEAPPSAGQGYVTDPELVQQLNQGYVNDSELLKQLENGPVEPTGGDLLKSAVGAVAPAAYTPGATGVGELAKDVGKAVIPAAVNAGKTAVANYAKNPLGAVADAVLVHGGMPPVYGLKKGYEGGKTAWNAAKEVASNLGEILGKQPANIRQAFDTLGNRLGVDGVNAFEKAYEANVAKLGDANKAVQQTLKEFQPPDYIGKGGREALSELQQGFKPITALDKVGKVFGPIARAVGKVAGPAGLAMNAYDAAQFAQEADLGGRLARGEGKLAPQAFRNLNNMNVSGYQPSPEEARNLLASGDERTINIYGGRLRLEGLASPGPNAIKSGFDKELADLDRKRKIGR